MSFFPKAVIDHKPIAGRVAASRPSAATINGELSLFLNQGMGCVTHGTPATDARRLGVGTKPPLLRSRHDVASLVRTALCALPLGASAQRNKVCPFDATDAGLSADCPAKTNQKATSAVRIVKIVAATARLPDQSLRAVSRRRPYGRSVDFFPR